MPGRGRPRRKKAEQKNLPKITDVIRKAEDGEIKRVGTADENGVTTWHTLEEITEIYGSSTNEAIRKVEARLKKEAKAMEAAGLRRSGRRRGMESEAWMVEDIGNEDVVDEETTEDEQGSGSPDVAPPKAAKKRDSPKLARTAKGKERAKGSTKLTAKKTSRARANAAASPATKTPKSAQSSVKSKKAAASKTPQSEKQTPASSKTRKSRRQDTKTPTNRRKSAEKEQESDDEEEEDPPVEELTPKSSIHRKHLPPLPAERPRYPHRRCWTAEETEGLMDGVKRFGVGCWSLILRHTPVLFTRSQVDLKDKWRTIQRREERKAQGLYVQQERRPRDVRRREELERRARLAAQASAFSNDGNGFFDFQGNGEQPPPDDSGVAAGSGSSEAHERKSTKTKLFTSDSNRKRKRDGESVDDGPAKKYSRLPGDDDESEGPITLRMSTTCSAGNPIQEMSCDVMSNLPGNRNTVVGRIEFTVITPEVTRFADLNRRPCAKGLTVLMEGIDDGNCTLAHVLEDSLDAGITRVIYLRETTGKGIFAAACQLASLLGDAFTIFIVNTAHVDSMWYAIDDWTRPYHTEAAEHLYYRLLEVDVEDFDE